jgi:putative transposase
MLEDRLGLSERRACQIAGQHRSTQRRERVVAEDDAACGHVFAGFPASARGGATAVLRGEGWQINRKRVQRVWREEGLRVPQRRRKRQRLGDCTVPPTGCAPSAPTTCGRLTSSSTRPPTGTS